MQYFLLEAIEKYTNYLLKLILKKERERERERGAFYKDVGVMTQLFKVLSSKGLAFAP